jgi:hypothetical protein
MKDIILDMLKNPANRKWFIIGVAVAILIGIVALQSAFARPSHHHHAPPPTVTTTSTTTPIVVADNSFAAKGASAAMATGYCQFDYSPGFQGCASTATWGDEWGLNFQVGKRVNNLLINGGVTCDPKFEECGAGAALNWHF